MENEIKVGEYVRTKDGILFKTTEYWVGEYEKEPEIYTNIIKHSFNIIDLIEEGDYVNGCLITAIYDEYKNDNTIQFETNYEGRYRYYSDGDIKSIVTKEQFEQMKYKVKE